MTNTDINTDTKAETTMTETLTPPVMKNYVCYLTQQRGNQPAGYITNIRQAQRVDDLPTDKNSDNPEWWTNTAWAEDPDYNYKMSRVYPELLKKQSLGK